MQERSSDVTKFKKREGLNIVILALIDEKMFKCSEDSIGDYRHHVLVQ